MGKLVRDKIPAIILKDGRIPQTHTLSQPEYVEELLSKFREEADEFLASRSVEEIIDLIEVLLAYAKTRGYSHEQLEQLRKKKRTARGGFEKRIYLDRVE